MMYRHNTFIHQLPAKWDLKNNYDYAEQKTYHHPAYFSKSIAHTINSDAVHRWSKLDSVRFYYRWSSVDRHRSNVWACNTEDKANQVPNRFHYRSSDNLPAYLGRTCSWHLRDTTKRTVDSKLKNKTLLATMALKHADNRHDFIARSLRLNIILIIYLNLYLILPLKSSPHNKPQK